MTEEPTDDGGGDYDEHHGWHLEDARRVLSDVDAVVPELALARDLAPGTIGAAGLLRCRALLREVIVVYENQCAIGLGALLRSLFETWGVTLYAVVGGEAALDELLGEHYKQVKPWISGRNEELDQPLEQVPARRLTFRSLTERLAERMRQRSMVNAQLPLDGYDTIYRIESGTSVHGGLTAILLPLLTDEGELDRGFRFDSARANHQLFLAGLLVAELAYWITNLQELDSTQFAWSQVETQRQPTANQSPEVSG